MSFLIAPHAKVLFTGDSITDCGRRSPNPPLGTGYVKMANDLIIARYPAHQLEVINTGISGNTVRDLFNRWTDDVIRYQPDWLSIMIGVNDIHRWLSHVDGQSVSPAEFRDLYGQILQRARNETSAKIILIEPFYISADTDSESFRSRVLRHLPEYHATVEKLVEQFETYYVRFHSMFQEQIKTLPPEYFCPEPVHPNSTGHLVMAHEWLKALEFWVPGESASK